MKELKQKVNLRTTLEETVKEWNVWFPFDYRWRKKYNVPFGSEKHLNTSFFFMLYDLQEEKMFNELIEKANNEELDGLLEGEENRRSEIINMSKKEINDEFENLDLSKF